MIGDKNKHIYCTNCGTKLIEKVVKAEKVLEGSGEFSWPKYYRYNEEIGQRQYIKMRICPKKGKFTWGHDEYFIDKVIYKK